MTRPGADSPACIRLLLADTIGADEARALGPVTWVRPDSEIDEFVAGVAQRPATGSPTAPAQTTALLADSGERSLDHALAAETRSQAVNLAGPMCWRLSRIPGKTRTGISRGLGEEAFP
ncbi:hypothetical protein ACWCPQ_05095 [Nocardia sp. NPDC001965]